MNSQHTYELGSPGEQGKHPVEMMCDLLLAESIRTPFAALRLTVVDGKLGVVQARAGGEWKDIMKLPLPVYSALTAQFKVIAGLRPETLADQESRLVVREDDRDTTMSVAVSLNASGKEEFLLDFSHEGPQTPT